MASWRRVLWQFVWIGLTSFGASRWVYLHAAFVRRGWITEDAFYRDFAMSQVFPGASFVNLIALCGMRLGGVLMGLAGLLVATLPGAVLIVAAMVFMTGTNPTIDRVLHGTVVGAIALLTSALVRMSRRSSKSLGNVLLALATFGLSVAGVPLIVTVLAVGAVAFARAMLLERPMPA